MKCVYFYVLALTLAFPRDVRHVCPVVESVTSWGARCTRRVRVVPDVPLTLNKRKRARELLSQHIFGHNNIVITQIGRRQQEIYRSPVGERQATLGFIWRPAVIDRTSSGDRLESGRSPPGHRPKIWSLEDKIGRWPNSLPAAAVRRPLADFTTWFKVKKIG